jgi:hypothetical protein
MITIKTLGNNKTDKKIAKAAVKARAEVKDWYVLKYDTETTAYNNEIVFKTLDEAVKEFSETEPSYKNERVELIFAPEDGDPDFGDNVVVNYKEYKEEDDSLATTITITNTINSTLFR